MRIIAQSRRIAFRTQKAYKAAEEPLKAWHDGVKLAEWKNFNDVKAGFPKASLVGNGWVVFNMHGDAFRVIVKIEFRMSAVLIGFFGTRKEYDAINADEG